MARNTSSTIFPDSMPNIPLTNDIIPTLARKADVSALPLGESVLPYPLRNAANGVPQIPGARQGALSTISTLAEDWDRT